MGKRQRLKEQYSDMDISLIDIVVSIDPSSTKRYSEFLLKTIKDQLEGGDMTSVVGNLILGEKQMTLLKTYHEHFENNRINKTDISEYKNFKEISEQVRIADDVLLLKEMEKQILPIFRNEEWFIFEPYTYEACKIYGKGTKWCITNKMTWGDYKRDGYRFIFIINIKTQKKWAIAIKHRRTYELPTQISGWNEQDKSEEILLWDLSPEILGAIRGHINITLNDILIRQLKPGVIELDNDIIPYSRANYASLELFLRDYKSKISSEYYNQVKTELINRVPLTNPKRKAELMKKY